jgi:hypothetical protein
VQIEKKAEMARRAKMTNEQQSEDAKRQAGDARAEAARLQVGGAAGMRLACKRLSKKTGKQLATCNVPV